MNIANLLHQSPESTERLKRLGLGDEQVQSLITAVHQQLDGLDADNLTGAEFARQLNLPQLADTTLLSTQSASAAVTVLARLIDSQPTVQSTDQSNGQSTGFFSRFSGLIKRK